MLYTNCDNCGGVRVVFTGGGGVGLIVIGGDI